MQFCKLLTILLELNNLKCKTNCSSSWHNCCKFGVLPFKYSVLPPVIRVLCQIGDCLISFRWRQWAPLGPALSADRRAVASVCRWRAGFATNGRHLAAAKLDGPSDWLSVVCQNASWRNTDCVRRRRGWLDIAWSVSASASRSHATAAIRRLHRCSSLLWLPPCAVRIK